MLKIYWRVDPLVHHSNLDEYARGVFRSRKWVLLVFVRLSEVLAKGALAKLDTLGFYF